VSLNVKKQRRTQKRRRIEERKGDEKKEEARFSSLCPFSRVGIGSISSSRPLSLRLLMSLTLSSGECEQIWTFAYHDATERGQRLAASQQKSDRERKQTSASHETTSFLILSCSLSPSLSCSLSLSLSISKPNSPGLDLSEDGPGRDHQGGRSPDHRLSVRRSLKLWSPLFLFCKILPNSGSLPPPSTPPSPSPPPKP